ncbi:hypothetical protein F4779DRAFT_617472 [Xylariaceae sp. FL0662B]|nr:hypothetical protein F4779DRAFT_617472 [Xylariaceae sp. FL0662B]
MGRSKKPVVKKSRATSRARGNGRRALPPPPSPIGRVTSGSLRPEQIVTFDPNLVQRWNRPTENENSIAAFAAMSQSPDGRAASTWRSAMLERDVIIRAEAASAVWCSRRKARQSTILIHTYDPPLRLPTPMENACGADGQALVPTAKVQESMFRHVRKHQVKAARAAGDVVDGLAESDSDTDADDDDDDTESIDDIPDGRNGKDDHQGPPPSGSVGQEILAN